MSIARRRLDGDVFEREFAIESLKSERLRVTILMGAIASSVTLLILSAFVETSIPTAGIIIGSYFLGPRERAVNPNLSSRLVTSQL